MDINKVSVRYKATRHPVTENDAIVVKAAGREPDDKHMAFPPDGPFCVAKFHYGDDFKDRDRLLAAFQGLPAGFEVKNLGPEPKPEPRPEQMSKPLPRLSPDPKPVPAHVPVHAPAPAPDPEPKASGKPKHVIGRYTRKKPA